LWEFVTSARLRIVVDPRGGTPMRLRTILAVLTVATLALPIDPARAADVETVVSLDLGAGELPTGSTGSRASRSERQEATG
jgi:hypothetical protein